MHNYACAPFVPFLLPVEPVSRSRSPQSPSNPFMPFLCNASKQTKDQPCDVMRLCDPVSSWYGVAVLILSYFVFQLIDQLPCSIQCPHLLPPL